MQFQEVLKKEHVWKFQELIKKGVEFPGVFMCNFHEFWFLILKFPRGVTQFCRIFMGKSFF